LIKLAIHRMPHFAHIRNSIYFITLALLIGAPVRSFGQLRLDDIKLTRIEHKKIREYIAGQIKSGKHQFSEIHTSWKKGKELTPYSRYDMTFSLNGSLQNIWKGYLSADPSKLWNGRNISFGLLLQRSPNRIFYIHDSIRGIDTGQIYFLNLKVLLGLVALPVAFEIITIDGTEKEIDFSYLEDNKSVGVQKIRFREVDGCHTEILHTSYFKSDSRFRDKWLYPIFHKKLVNEFHGNMKKLIVAGNLPDQQSLHPF